MDAGTDECRMDKAMRRKGLRGKSVEGMEARQVLKLVALHLNNTLLKKNNLPLLLYAWHFDIFYGNNPICISQDKENQPTRQEQKEQKETKQTTHFPRIHKCQQNNLKSLQLTLAQAYAPKPKRARSSSRTFWTHPSTSHGENSLVLDG